MKNSKRLQIPNQLHFSTPYEKKQLSTAILESGAAYQRKVDSRTVQKIMDEFDPKLLDEIIVSFRGGRYHVVDGQHRIVALKIMNGGRDCIVSCKVVNGLTYEQEADLYKRLDACKKKLSIIDSTRAAVEANDDPKISSIKRVLDAYGLEWALSVGKSGGRNRIRGARTLLNIYRDLELWQFDETIRLIKTTWDGAENSLNMYILSGVALFVKTYGKEISEDIFVKRLKKIDPAKIVSHGKADISTNIVALKYARVILRCYNARCGKNALPYNFKG